MGDEQQHTPEQIREFELEDLRSRARFYWDFEHTLVSRADSIVVETRQCIRHARPGDNSEVASLILAACACAAEARALRAEIAALEAGGGTDG